MNPPKKHLAVFGYGLSIILGLIAFKIWRGHGFVFLHSIVLAGMAFFGYAGKFRHDLLVPIYIRWMKVAHFIGNFITALILSIIFYTLFAFMGIVLRLMRKDLLDQAIDTNTQSYWHKKEAVSGKEHYTRQF